MNVAQTIVPGNSDVVKQTGRQDRDSASKKGGSGFSDTLGSLDKKSSAPQSSSSASGNSSTASSTTATATSGQPTATTVADGGKTPVNDGTTPMLPVANGLAKPVAPNTLFMDATQTLVGQPNDGTFVNGADAAKLVETVSNTVPQLANTETDAAVLPEMSDLAKLVTALSKPIASTASSQGDATVEGTSDAEAETDAPATDVAGEGMDLLSLLASTTMPVNQAAPSSNQAANPSSEGLAGMALDQAAPAEVGTTSSTVVRLQKQDTPAIDFHIETQEDGTAKLDVSTAAGDVSNVVQVVESRRFVGMAAASNAAAISSAMVADPDWATTMAGQTSNGPMISSTGQVVHVLKIQMSPVELGHVTAAMKLVGDELSVQLTAHTLKGYSELQKDSSDILDALKSQGFSVDQVTVTLASGADRQDSSTSNRQPPDSGHQGAQQGQRGNEEKSQEQFYRQSGGRAREETISHESTSQPEVPARVTSARPDHVYL